MTIVPAASAPPALPRRSKLSTYRQQEDIDELPAPAGLPVAVGLGARRHAANILAGGVVNLLKTALQLVMLPVLAHLLGPNEFGLYALALPTITLFSAFADAGLGTAFARADPGLRIVWSTAFWLLGVVGIVLGGAVVGCGLLVATLSGDSRVAPLMALLSLSLPLITMSALPTSRLTRQGRLAFLSGVDLAAATAGAAMALALATAGAGAWSLAAQYVTAFVIRAVVLNVASPVWPFPEFDFPALRPHLATGGSLVSGRVGEFAGRLVENLLVGRSFGADVLGSYAFATQSSKFITEAASGPVWGVLYTVALRKDEARMVAVHHRLLYLLAAAVLPVAFLLSAAADVLPSLLGQRWAEAAPLLQVLLPSQALAVIAVQATALLLATGRSWMLLTLMAGSVLLRLAAMASTLWLGPVGVAWGVAVAQLAFAAMLVVTQGRLLSTGLIGFSAAVAAPFAASVVAAGVCFGLLQLRSSGFAWPLGCLAASIAVYLVALLALDGTRFREALSSARMLTGRP